MATSTRTSIMLLALEEVIIGLVSGGSGFLIAVIIMALFDFGLYKSILYSLIIGGICMFGGASLVAYKYLRAEGRIGAFNWQVIQGLIGMIIGLALFYTLLVLPPDVIVAHSLINTSVVVLPLLGLLVGLNHRIRYE